MAYPFQLVQLLQVQVHRRSFEHHICFNDNDLAVIFQYLCYTKLINTWL